MEGILFLELTHGALYSLKTSIVDTACSYMVRDVLVM